MELKKRYSLVAAGMGAFLYVGNFLAVLLYMALPEKLLDNTWLAWFLQDLASVAGLLLAWRIVSRIPEKPHMRKDMRIADFFLTLGVIETVSLISALAILLVFSLLGIENGTYVVDEIVDNDLLVQLVFVCVTGPIIEELVCRKLIVDKLRDAGEKRAVLLSALFFALMHGNAYQFAYAFPVGLLLAYVYLRTNNIGYPILLHMLNNLSGVVTIPYATGLGIFATLYVLFIRQPRIHFEETEDVPWRDVWINGGMLFAAVILAIRFVSLGS